MIELKNVSKIYKTKNQMVQALKDIDLKIEEGEVIAVCGPSGAGKSTLLHILGLMDKPSSGIMNFMGKDVHILDEKKRSELRNRYIGFLFQFHYLIDEFTVMENIIMPALIKGENGRDSENINSLMVSLGIDSLSDRYPQELSGGEQQRVALARALVNSPKIILADEPTGNLDSRNSEIVLNLLLKKVKEIKTTLVIATHDKDIAERANRIVNMKDGSIHEIIENRIGVRK